MTKIISVEFPFTGGEIENIQIWSQSTLLDGEIIVFNVGGFSSLSDYDQFQDAVNHWASELDEALSAGHTIFVLLDSLIDMGDLNNYRPIPGGLRIKNSEGKSMKLTSGFNPLNNYWEKFKQYSIYRAYVEKVPLRGQPLIVSTSGDRILAAKYQISGKSGNLILLPTLNFEQFSGRSENWTDKEIEVGRELYQVLCTIHESLKSGTEIPPPPWAQSEMYKLPAERSILDELVVLQANAEQLASTIQEKKLQAEESGEMRWLLFENGARLEAAIIKALKILGFEATAYKDASSQFDVVFKCPEGRLLGEVEGKENKAINIDKFRQLHLNLFEEFEKVGGTMAKGVLFGNAFRLLPPKERGDFFTPTCLTAANTKHVALVKTVDLFEIARHLSEKPDPSFAAACRTAILSTDGVVFFPEFVKEQKADSHAN